MTRGICGAEEYTDFQAPMFLMTRPWRWVAPTVTSPSVVAEASDRVLVMYAGRIVELAKTLDLFRAPRHPYARGLLDSIPGLREGPLASIPGTVPDPHAYPPGCRFHPRCGRAEARS